MPVLSMSDDKEEIDVKPFRKVRKPCKATRRFQMYWLKKFPWLERGQTDTARARCKYCDHYFMLKKSMFEQHERTSKHVKKKVQYEKGQPPSGYCDGIVSKCLELDDNEDDITLVSSKVMETAAGDEPTVHRREESANTDSHKIRKKSVTMKTVTSKNDKGGQTANGFSYYIVRSSSNIIGLQNQMTPGVQRSREPKEDNVQSVTESNLQRVACELSSRFTVDLKLLLARNRTLRDFVNRHSELSDTAEGITRLKKILVGHLAQHYLAESTMELRRRKISPFSVQDNISMRIEDLKLKVERSVNELQTLKIQVQEEESWLPQVTSIEADVEEGDGMGHTAES